MAFAKKIVVGALFLMMTGCIVAGPIAIPQSTSGAAHSNDKVTICHKGKTMTVSQSAVLAHLKHGDSKGRCR